jgi:hypothetical protein
MIGFINTFVYNLSYSQSIITLSLIYPLHKSLGHVIRFLATDLSQKLALQITMKSSCRLLFNHLELQTLQNSTQFSNSNSLILVNLHFIFFRLGTPRELFWLQTELSVTAAFSLYSLGSDHSTEDTAPVLLATCIERCIATVAARTTENTAPVLSAACVSRALPSNWSMRHSIFNTTLSSEKQQILQISYFYHILRTTSFVFVRNLPTSVYSQLW